MKPKKIIWISIGVLTVIFLLFIFDFSGERKNKVGPISFEAQIDGQRAVTVVVTPERDQVDKSRWSFEVVLDTHSVELNEDLVQATILLDSNGKEYKPIVWEGDSPQGHHRKGVLRFDSVWPLTTLIELKIRDIGGVPERTFKWLL